MAPKRRLMDQPTEGDSEEPPRKRLNKKESEETALAICRSPKKPRRQKSEDDEEQSALMPVKRGGGKGLKAVQTSHEQTRTNSKVNGEKEESQTKVKEQKLYHARSNAHVETKVVTEDSRKKIGKNGTTTITSSTTVKKVTYL